MQVRMCLLPVYVWRIHTSIYIHILAMLSWLFVCHSTRIKLDFRSIHIHRHIDSRTHTRIHAVGRNVMSCALYERVGRFMHTNNSVSFTVALTDNLPE